MKRPTAATTRQGADGRRTTSAAGTTTAVKRTAAKRSGGTPCIPQSMTTKLNPQIVATAAASIESLRSMPPSVPDHDHEAPANAYAPIHVASLHDRPARPDLPPGRRDPRLGGGRRRRPRLHAQRGLAAGQAAG